MQTLLVRADSSVAMGTGHVMRCLALAQAWQDHGGNVVFAMAQTMASISDRLSAGKVSVTPIKSASGTHEDAKELAEISARYEAAWVVVDGYQFDDSYQSELKVRGLKVLFVDDSGHAAHYHCDVVLNQNAHASAELYQSRDASTQLLLGPKYALLRREFRSESGFQREIAPQARKVLVTMGGSDPENLTLQIIQAFGGIDVEGLEAAVVAGGSNPHVDSLKEAADSLDGKVRVMSDVTDMATWMKWADVAVSAAGSTCWEMCLLGLPAMLIDFAPNQTPVARELDRLGAALHFGDAARVTPQAIADQLKKLMLSPERRLAMSRKAAGLVDGRGSERVVAVLRGGGLQLRSVTESDCRQLWDWANDPLARRVSFSPEPIAWENHVKWFRARLEDKNTLIYIAVAANHLPVGYVRYQIDGERAVISINVDRQQRGHGYGETMLRMANQELFRDSPASVIEAFVKDGNEISNRLFAGVGFERHGDRMVNGYAAAYFTLRKNGSRG